MTTTNNMVAKIAAAVAGLGLVFSAFAPIASAQSETTQAQIDALLAQIAALQAQLGDNSASASMTFTRDLTIGSTGADVTALQNWLISKGHTIAAGATGYFGAQTQAALAAYQASVSISPAAGYFGPITRAHVNAQAGGSTGGDTDGDGDEDEDDEDEDDELDGGEADLSEFDISDEESSGAEGEAEVEVFTVEFDVEDGDVRVERLEILASSTDDGIEADPWDFFDRVSVWADGEEVAEMDVDDRDSWDEEDGDGADIHRLDLDLDHVVREGEMAELTVAFDIASNIDDADLAQEFAFSIPDDGIRAVDSEGVQHYIPNGESDTIDFTFDEEETGDLDINTSSDDPDNMTLVSDEDEESEEYSVFVFELENNEDVEVLVTDLTIDVATSSGDSIDSLLESATLVVDGEEYDGDINDDGTIDFEDVDFTIGGDESVDVELMVTLAEDADGTVEFSIDAADVTAESEDTGEDTDVSGSASSEEHTVALTGVSTTAVETESDVNDDNTIGTYSITFEVTAEGDDDIYILNDADDNENNTSTSTSEGVMYDIYSGGTAMSATTSDSAILQSGADTETVAGFEYYIVESGTTEEFTLTVTLDPALGSGTALYYVELDKIRFDEDTDTYADDSTYTVPDDADYETDAETIAAS